MAENYWLCAAMPSDALRGMFVDGVLPVPGDVIEQVVVAMTVDGERSELTTKLRVVRATQDREGRA